MATTATTKRTEKYRDKKINKVVIGFGVVDFFGHIRSNAVIR